MSDHHMTLSQPYNQSDPLDMQDAREAARRAAQLRRDAEADYRKAIEDRAEKEAAYREQLSKTIVKLKNAGEAATVANERARGEPEVKPLLIDFRVAEGMVEAYKQRLIGIEGERSSLRGLIDYSARISAALRDQEPGPDGQTFGGRDVTPTVQDEIDRRRRAAA